MIGVPNTIKALTIAVRAFKVLWTSDLTLMNLILILLMVLLKYAHV